MSKRIANLAPYPIDLFQNHLPYSLSSIPARMREMAALLLKGRTRAVGVSNFSAEQMELAYSPLAQGLFIGSRSRNRAVSVPTPSA
jgi:diketogulonate reductase-like aldo/keto reductase